MAYLAVIDIAGLNIWVLGRSCLYGYHVGYLLENFVYDFAPKLVSLKNVSSVGVGVVYIHSYSPVSLPLGSEALDLADHRPGDRGQ